MAERDVVVTGATGMLASYLIAGIDRVRLRLGIEGSVTYAASRRYGSGYATSGDRKGSVRFVSLDLVEAAIVASRECIVIHAASPASPQEYLNDPVGCMEVNTERTRILLGATKKAGGTFVFLSSGEVYGTAPPVPTSEHQYAELDHTRPRNIYAEAKRAGEAITLAANRVENVDVRIARLFHTFGPGVDPRDERIFSGLVRSAVQGRDFVLRSSGEAYRAFLYSYDLLEGLAHMYAKLGPGSVANVASSDGEQIRNVAKLALDAMSKNQLRILTTTHESSERNFPESPILSNIADNSLLRATGWSPQVSLEEAFRRTLESALWRNSMTKAEPRS